MPICAILILATTLIPVLSLTEAEEEQRLKQEIAASAVNRVDFSKVGSEVDVIRFGTVYEAESRSHDIQGKFGDMQAWNMTMGRNQFVEWTFTVPQAGDYVLTIAADIARLPDRRGEISIQIQNEWRDYGQIAESGQYHCTVTLPKGGTRFRLANAGGGLFYTSGARLSTVCDDPWINLKPGEHPRLQFDRAEIAKIQQSIASDPDHPVRYYYDGLLAAAENQAEKPSRLNGPRASAQALNEVAIAYALTGKEEYADRGIDYLERLSQRDFGRNPSSVLGNGEYLDCMAWGYDVLFDNMFGTGRRFPVWNFQHGHPDAVVWYDDTVPVEDPDTSPQLALLYPTSTEHPVPPFTSISTDDLMGMQTEHDVVLWNQNGASWEHEGMKTDGEI